jgi:hypothetical protein
MTPEQLAHERACMLEVANEHRAAKTPESQPEAVDDAPYWLKPGERFCLGCNKLGHFTNDCHSTFSANDAASRELGRLCWAANRATHVAGTTELEAAARAILQDHACQMYITEYLRDNLRATFPPTK